VAGVSAIDDGLATNGAVATAFFDPLLDAGGVEEVVLVAVQVRNHVLGSVGTHADDALVLVPNGSE